MRVLIVENDAVVTKLWERWLSDFYTVEIANSVDLAIESIKRNMPDIVLLDLRLNGPTNSGLEVYEYIRRELEKDTPIIFITGLEFNIDLYKKAEEKVEIDIQRGLCTSMVQKPISIQTLGKLVADAVT